MTATATRPRTRKTATKPARPVRELLLEIAYHLHATHVVARPARKLDQRAARVG